MSAVKIGERYWIVTAVARVHALQGDEKGEEGERAEGAARNQERVIVAFPIELSARYRHATDQPRDEATEEDDLHRRDAIELFHEDVHDRKGQRRQKHVGHAAAEQARIARKQSQPADACRKSYTLVSSARAQIPVACSRSASLARGCDNFGREMSMTRL